MMMGGSMVWGSLLLVVTLIGFAYIVWILAAKETGTVKTIGQVIAVVIAVLALIIFLYGSIYGGMLGKGMMGRRFYGGHLKEASGFMINKMMNMSDDELQKTAEAIIRNPRMRKCLEDALEKQ